MVILPDYAQNMIAIGLSMRRNWFPSVKDNVTAGPPLYRFPGLRICCSHISRRGGWLAFPAPLVQTARMEIFGPAGWSGRAGVNRWT